jgi:N-acylneuraminate cytidylyltransferase
MKTIALIPARGGSKGIPRKNIKIFNSKPLIYWTIQAALESKYIDRVIVSTEDEEIAEIAKRYTAEVPFLRPKELAEDDSLGIDPVIHALEMLPNVEDILLMQPTSPLRKTHHIDEIFQLREKLKSDSAVSISLSRKHPNLFFKINSENIISPFSKDFKSLPRQKYSDLYTVNGALYLSSKKSILLNNSFFTSKTVGYIMPEKYSIDIDTQLDWDIAEFLMKRSL